MFSAGWRFEYPAVLLLIPLVAIPVSLLIWRRARQRESVLMFPGFGAALAAKELHARAKLPAPSWRIEALRLRPLLIFVALTLMILALARPRVTEKEVIIHREGVDIVMLFDISTSMRAADFKPNDRFTVARDTIAAFVKGRRNDRVGLVVFAGDAFTQVPLTSDVDIIVNVLDSIKMGVIEDGTAIGNAIATGINRLRDSESKSKVLVLLTDGDNNKGNIAPLEAASMAKEFGIRVHTIQVGKGGLVDYPVNGGVFGMMYQKVNIPVNPKLLKDIAEETGGRYFLATDRDTLERVFRLIDDMEKTPLPEPDFVLYRERYADFAAPALALLVLDLLASAMLLRRLRGPGPAAGRG